MGCVKLHILDQQYKNSELKVSYINKKLTSDFCVEKERREILLRYIDPDGRDEWEFTAAGHFRNVKQTDFDSFHKVTIDRRGNSTRVEGGSLYLDKKVVTGTFTLEGSDKTAVNYLKITGDDAAKQIFEHVANNSTEYMTEYGLSRVGSNSGTSGLNLLGVNAVHTVGSTAANRVVFENDYTIREAIHNHPSGINAVSQGDVNVARMIQGKFPNATFDNYTIQYGYTPYNRYTVPNVPIITLPLIISNPR